MAQPNQEDIDTFIGITGLSKAVAIQKLQEHEGDLNRAVNAHFNEGDRNRARETTAVVPQDDFMDVDDPLQPDHELSRNSSLPSEPSNQAPFASQPIERRDLPIEGDLTRGPDLCSTEAHETIVVDDYYDEEEVENRPSARNVWDVRRPHPSAPALNSVQEPDFDVEEEMIRAAIEVSKREASRNEDIDSRDDSVEMRLLARAASLEGSHQEPVLCRHVEQESELPEVEDFLNPSSTSERLETGSSFVQGLLENLGENAPYRQRTRHLSSGSVDSSSEVGELAASPPSSPTQPPQLNDNPPQVQHNANGFPADEWGGISSMEHDEAVMLEAAMFGVPETSEYNAFAARHITRSNLNGNFGPYPRPEPRPPSPNLTEQRMLREQQDDEYFASLQADIEKDEARRLEEQAAREAAREEQKRREEESVRKLEEEQELERQLAAKEASIPFEPTPDDVHAVNLLVRMPDGSRRGRRFLKSDRLKSLFDYIDVGRAVKPGTYKLARPYPRRAYGDGDTVLTFNELGLTSKQEVLYLELV